MSSGVARTAASAVPSVLLVDSSMVGPCSQPFAAVRPWRGLGPGAEEGRPGAGPRVGLVDYCNGLARAIQMEAST